MSVKGEGAQHLYESQYFYLCASLNTQMKSWKQSNWESMNTILYLDFSIYSLGST